MAENKGQGAQHEDVKCLPSLVSIAKSIAGHCVEHPALMLSLAYLYVPAIGMLYTSALFSAFGINILDFAETTDFLLAALRRPIALVLSAFVAAWWLGYVLLVYAVLALVDRPPAWVRRPVSTLAEHLPRFMVRSLEGMQKSAIRSPREYLGLVTFLALISWCYTGLYALSTFADGEAEKLASGESALLVVELRSSDAAGLSTVIEENMSLIGSTSSFAFFYSHIDQCTQVIPTANILRVYAVPPKPLATPTPTTEAHDAGSGASTAVAR